jgi:hypothetical protein
VTTQDGELLELEYVETEAGDVFASALVDPSGRVVAVIDDDGNDLSAWPIETGRRGRAYLESRREQGL